jgi:hypothetical protein
MKTFLSFCFATVTMLAIGFAQTPSTSPAPTKSTTTKTHASAAPLGANEAVGTIVEFVPGGDIVLNTGAAEPARFKMGKGVRYLNPKGKEVNERKMKKDRRVRVHYAKEGNDLVVDKIQIEREGGKKKAKH